MFTKGRDTTPVSCLHPSYRHCWLFGEKVIFTSAAAKRLLALSMQLKSDKLFLCPILTPSASWRRILANNTIRQRNKRRRTVDHGPDELAESRHLNKTLLFVMRAIWMASVDYYCSCVFGQNASTESNEQKMRDSHRELLCLFRPHHAVCIRSPFAILCSCRFMHQLSRWNHRIKKNHTHRREREKEIKSTFEQ